MSCFSYHGHDGLFVLSERGTQQQQILSSADACDMTFFKLDESTSQLYASCAPNQPSGSSLWRIDVRTNARLKVSGGRSLGGRFFIPPQLLASGVWAVAPHSVSYGSDGFVRVNLDSPTEQIVIEQLSPDYRCTNPLRFPSDEQRLYAVCSGSSLTTDAYSYNVLACDLSRVSSGLPVNATALLAGVALGSRMPSVPSDTLCARPTDIAMAHDQSGLFVSCSRLQGQERSRTQDIVWLPLLPPAPAPAMQPEQRSSGSISSSSSSSSSSLTGAETASSSASAASSGISSSSSASVASSSTLAASSSSASANARNAASSASSSAPSSTGDDSAASDASSSTAPGADPTNAAAIGHSADASERAWVIPLALLLSLLFLLGVILYSSRSLWLPQAQRCCPRLCGYRVPSWTPSAAAPSPDVDLTSPRSPQLQRL